jgi:hypothetical protein
VAAPNRDREGADLGATQLRTDYARARRLPESVAIIEE